MSFLVQTKRCVFMSNFVIIPDASCDLTRELRQRFDIPEYLRGHITFPDGHDETCSLDWETSQQKSISVQ